MSSLSLFKQERYQAREKKKKSKKGGGGGERKGGGGASFGKVLRQPALEGGAKISCGCGRVYLLPSALGGYIFFDSEGELGKASLSLGDLDNGPASRGPYRVEMVERAHGILHRYGCKVHEKKLEGPKLVVVPTERTVIHTHGRGEK